ncbi:MAG: hypothetical protein KME31_20525 [Tolypothrix carrinoi HA7290-LM1]|nr:hypothetical protein [Tolypothrix carrinoi HA7290-LM1]
MTENRVWGVGCGRRVWGVGCRVWKKGVGLRVEEKRGKGAEMLNFFKQRDCFFILFPYTPYPTPHTLPLTTPHPTTPDASTGGKYARHWLPHTPTPSSYSPYCFKGNQFLQSDT